jgi:glycosyltransferase (activator-dependent family)
MRVLITTCSEKTFLQTMAPLAWALRTAGHEVRFASQPELTDDITRTGLTAVPVGRNRGAWRLAEISPEDREAGRAGLPAPYDAPTMDPAALDWERMRLGYEQMVTRRHGGGWHMTDNFPMFADLVDFARQWQPDLVLWEPTTYAGAVAAKACGAAHGRLLWSIDVFGAARELFRSLNDRRPAEDRHDPIRQWLESYAGKFDFEFGEDLITGQFTVDQLPDSMRMEAGDLHYVPMQYIPYANSAVIPKWLWSAPERPRVALTLGITATDRFSGYAVSVQDILDSLADLDVEVVATIAESEQKRLIRIPDNTRVVSWVPLQALVQTCSAVIHHAGPGTLLTTAVAGVPQLAIPWDFDEPELARRAGLQGSTLVVPAKEATGRTVREAVLRLLREPAFGERATALRDEIRALPTPNQLVPQLEELTAKHRTAAR